ncbi:alkyl sulfatase dimerization domain-containing protein [Rhodococcus sp. LB1]|uniref:alkyl sulfatase dimerization domain-containing protein n=1 Tax=Rhodococcus sp. LB1 TaxID=1807499 RepID=UPI0018D4B3DA|nr:alkyl sulfatase dimerization domain-containing protein [Rhodococcus sp. LB1]
MKKIHRGGLSSHLSPAGTILELAELAWSGNLYTGGTDHPVHSTVEQSQEIADRIWVFEGMSSIAAIDTGAGLLILDAGGQPDSPEFLNQLREWRPDTEVSAVVLSHHHIDHIFGTLTLDAEAESMGRPKPVVYAHENLPKNFNRYVKTQGWNTAVNQRQFAIEKESFGWPAEYRYPNVTFNQTEKLRIGDLNAELTHARGETDDAVWTWIPELSLLHPGDLFIWAVPNAGNPQKVQRYASEWAQSLREMASKKAEIMVPGHGLPIIGAERVEQALIETAELLESIEIQTLRMMNEGATLDAILHSLEIPKHLLSRPYLRPVYDHPQFIARNIWRLYGGWYDGQPDNLLPAPRLSTAKQWISLSGGAQQVLDRAEELLTDGELPLACHLIEAVFQSGDSAPRTLQLRAEAYSKYAAQQESSIARNILNNAARNSATTAVRLATHKRSRETVKNRSEQ